MRVPTLKQIQADCVDGFEVAYWQRPDGILDPDAWREGCAACVLRSIAAYGSTGGPVCWE
jgi:hypothetical protein